VVLQLLFEELSNGALRGGLFCQVVRVDEPGQASQLGLPVPHHIS